MSPSMAVRRATKDHVPQLVTIYNQYVANSYATFDTEPAMVEGRLAWVDKLSDDGPHQAVVALDGSRVLGCAQSSPYREHPAFSETVEVGVYLDPEVRTRGIGTALYQALLDGLRAAPVHVALAGIALPNEASVALHRKFGFTEVGVFDEYARKDGAYLSSVWMQLRL